MARARNIKPGFFHNADLVELPIETRMLFIGLWTIADRDGRLPDRPKQIKMEIYPADSLDIEAMLVDLVEGGFIQRYQVDGKRFIQVENFLKHQHPHRDEKPSTIPAPCLHHASTMQNGLIPDSLLLIPDPCSSKLQPRTTSETETDPDGDAPAPVQPPPPASETPPAEKTTTLPPATPIADAVTVRAVSIAVLLRQRGAGVTAGDPRLRSWAERGIGDAALLLALETAESRRAQSGSLHPVNAGLLDAILGDVHAPPSRASPHGRQGERERYAASAAASQQRLGINTGANLERIEHDITGQSARIA